MVTQHAMKKQMNNSEINGIVLFIILLFAFGFIVGFFAFGIVNATTSLITAPVTMAAKTLKTVQYNGLFDSTESFYDWLDFGLREGGAFISKDGTALRLSKVQCEDKRCGFLLWAKDGTDGTQYFITVTNYPLN